MPASGSPPVTPAGKQAATHPGEFPQIPGHRLLRRLGQGGMATVYLAMQESLDRPVSIKVMEREALSDETSKSRFEHEARTIAKLTHPCIVNIYEVGRTADGRMYYIMPYLPNGDLAQRDLSNNEARIVDVLRSLLSALGYAHARGIVHRDVKEENVLFDAADRPLLTDFGIALSKRDTSRITTAGLAVGSSGYMAPEQARGDEVDGRADLYSVGVLAYDLLTGELPFKSSDALALALMHAQKDVPRLPSSKRHWQAFIDKAMAKQPALRFRNAQAMMHALDAVAHRTGNKIGARVLRKTDHALEGQIWKNPAVLAIGGVLLIGGGLYAARDRLPHFGSSATAAAPAAAVPTPTPAPEAAQPIAAAPKPVAALSVATPVQAPAVASTAAAPSQNATSAAVPGAVGAPPASAPLAPDAAVLGAARDAIAHGNLTAPPGESAVDLSLMVWKLSPGSPDANKLVGDVLSAMSAQQARTIVQNSDRNDKRAQDLQKKAQLLATATIGETAPGWRNFQTAVANALAKRAAQASVAPDAATLQRTDLLARQLDLNDPYNRAKTREVALAKAAQAAKSAAQAPTAPATPAVATVGAGFVPLHVAANGHAAAALARGEVTRHEYAQFVNATQRPASDCSSRKIFSSIFGGHRRNWTQPGFDQTDESPVVCVSWSDANAYVQWLNSRGGARYRLPNIADWNDTTGAGAGAPGIDARFNNWLSDCAGDCGQHLVAGRNWRDHNSSNPNAHGADKGYDDVGFRVVRESGNGH